MRGTEPGTPPPSPGQGGAGLRQAGREQLQDGRSVAMEI